MKFTNPNDGLTYYCDCSHVYNELGDRCTGCEIYRLSGPEKYKIVFGIGWSVCHPSDNFSRHKGLQLAVSRALEDTGWDRNVRTVVWDRLWSGKYSKKVPVNAVRLEGI
jgi:hypothetical protein